MVNHMSIFWWFGETITVRRSVHMEQFLKRIHINGPFQTCRLEGIEMKKKKNKGKKEQPHLLQVMHAIVFHKCLPVSQSMQSLQVWAGVRGSAWCAPPSCLCFLHFNALEVMCEKG